MPSTNDSLRTPHRRTMARVGWAGLNVTLTSPREPRAVVIVADGSGDANFMEGGAEVARALLDRGFAVVEVRLLGRREAEADAETSELRFNTGLLADRIAEVVSWIERQPCCRGLGIGIFATGTCGAGALRAAVRHPDAITAVVCRAARTDLIAGLLGRLCAETLLVLGTTDVAHLEASRSAQRLAPPGVIELGLVEAGRPLLETPTEREIVARLTCDWFTRAFAGESPRALKQVLESSTPRQHRVDDTTPRRAG